MSYEYDNYISDHRANLKKGLEWIYEHCPSSIINGPKMILSMMRADHHDESKFDKEEYDAYDAYFYGKKNKSWQVVQDFKLAWLRHQHLNPHHWQYWVLVNDEPDEGTIALEMPVDYVYEMIADWWTFSWRNGNLMEIFDWYDKHKEYIILHPKTRQVVEKILDSMKGVLEMQEKRNVKS